MAWTDERVEKLETLWTDGKSATDIAEELGGVSRNAVIGKIHRLGLAGKGGTPTMVKAPKTGQQKQAKKAKPYARPRKGAKAKSPLTRGKQGRKPSKPATPAQKLREKQFHDSATAQYKHLHEVPAGHCHFPIGDEGYCGRGVIWKRAAHHPEYCGDHFVHASSTKGQARALTDEIKPFIPEPYQPPVDGREETNVNNLSGRKVLTPQQVLARLVKKHGKKLS